MGRKGIQGAGLERVALIILCVFASVWLLVVLAVGLKCWLGLGNGDMSGWLQAVGSFIALGVAVWVPQREINRRNRDDLKKDIGLGRRLYYSAYEISRHVDSLFNAFELPDYRADESLEVFRGLYARLLKSFDDDHDPDRVKLSHELRQNLPSLIANLRIYADQQAEGYAKFHKAMDVYRALMLKSWEQLENLERDLPASERTSRVH